mgnify:CR=1 FL=1
MVICDKCGVDVKDLGRHHRRNRCKAQHIRLKDKPPRGKRLYGK